MNTSEFKSLHVSASDGVVRVDIDHGRANEMGRDQLQEWAKLTDLLEEGDARVVITTSRRRSEKGRPIFIAGANVTERQGWSDEKIRHHVRWQRATLARLRLAPVLHICVVGGVALGWGTEFLLACDYRIGTPDATFGLPETGLGILPGAGGTSDLWRVIGVAHALRLGMTGERIDGDEALRIGLLNELHADLDAGLARAEALAALVCRKSPTAVAAFKSAMLAGIGQNHAEAAHREAEAYELCLASGDAAIGRANFREINAGDAVQWGPRRRLQS